MNMAVCDVELFKLGLYSINHINYIFELTEMIESTSFPSLIQSKFSHVTCRFRFEYNLQLKKCINVHEQICIYKYSK